MTTITLVAIGMLLFMVGGYVRTETMDEGEEQADWNTLAFVGGIVAFLLIIVAILMVL